MHQWGCRLAAGNFAFALAQMVIAAGPLAKLSHTRSVEILGCEITCGPAESANNCVMSDTTGGETILKNACGALAVRLKSAVGPSATGCSDLVLAGGEQTICE